MPPINPQTASEPKPAPQHGTEAAPTLEERVREGAETFDFSALLRRTNGGDVAEARGTHETRPPRPRVRVPSWALPTVVLALVVFVGPLWLFLSGDVDAGAAQAPPVPPIAALQQTAPAPPPAAAAVTPAAPAGAAAAAAGRPDDDIIPQSEVAVPDDPPMRRETDPRYLFEPTDTRTLTSVMSRMPSKLKAQWRANGGNSRNTVFARGGDTHLDLAYFSSGGTVRRIWQTWPYREWADSWRVLGHIPGARSITMVLLRKTKGLEVRVRDSRGRTWRSREVNPNTDRCYWSAFKPD